MRWESNGREEPALFLESVPKEANYFYESIQCHNTCKYKNTPVFSGYEEDS